MRKMLLVTLPFLNHKVKYYPAAYVAGIVKAAGWKCHLLDLNYEIYVRSPENVKKAWNTSGNKPGIGDPRDIGNKDFEATSISFVPSVIREKLKLLAENGPLTLSGSISTRNPECSSTHS